MVKLVRPRKVPEGLKRTNKDFLECIKGMTREEAYRFYDEHKQKYKYNTKETKEIFEKMNQKRCSFCTQYISEFEKKMTVEHIELKSVNPKKIFQWNNLLCSCGVCNSSRSTNKYKKEMYLDPTKVKGIETYFRYKLDGSIVVNENLTLEEQEKAKYMIQQYKLDRDALNVERRQFLEDMTDPEFYQILKKKDNSNPHIIFLSVFTYYKERVENNGK